MSVYVPLNGSKRELLPNSHAAGPVDLSEIVSLTIRVRSAGDPMDLVQRAHELGRTPVAERRYLTHAELAEQHGAAEADLDAVAQFATRHDLVVVRLVVSAMVKGTLLGVPADGKPVRWSAVDIYRVTDGKISEEWAADDVASTMIQVGAFTPPWAA